MAALAFLALWTTATGAATREAPPPLVYVLPLGERLPAADVEGVRAALVAFYAADVRVLPQTHRFLGVR